MDEKLCFVDQLGMCLTAMIEIKAKEHLHSAQTKYYHHTKTCQFLSMTLCSTVRFSAKEHVYDNLICQLLLPGFSLIILACNTV